MKFSENWLRKLVNPKINTTQLVEQLTAAGLEVDSTTSVSVDFSKVVIAEIIDVQPHPDAERLRVCQVKVNQKQAVTIVTNVADVTVGMKVACALEGAQLPNLEIKTTKLRGVTSQGMFCGYETLGMGEASAGLVTFPFDAPIGAEVRKYLELDDTIIDIELTPNRGDCLSLTGIAREVAVANHLKIKPSKLSVNKVTIDTSITTEVKALEACPHYFTRVIKNINVNTVTPIEMRETLRRSGIRSIHPVVDVTNYVMLELGQPMHAFDLAKIHSGLMVRFAKPQEKLTLLDGNEIELSKDVLVIADKKHALALAGVMGGLDSAVTTETVDIVLESAYFAPLTIQGRARRYGLHTEGSHRFERGVDYTIQEIALERATTLITQLVGGQAGPIQKQVAKEYLPKRKAIKLREPRLAKLLGCKIPKREITNILQGLGMQVKVGKESWSVMPPSYRFDINLEVDLIEEVARIYGYDHIPAQLPRQTIQMLPIASEQVPVRRFAHLLKDLGYQEAITYSFINPKWQEALILNSEGLCLANPISSELSVMRTTLWSGLLPALQNNLQHQQERVRLFEIGTRFVEQKGQLQQLATIAGVAIGDRVAEQWDETKQAVDFYAMKADVEKLLALTGKPYSWQTANHPALHPGRSAAIYRDAQLIGWLGELHPRLQQAWDLGRVMLFELDMALLNQATLTHYQSVSKYPAVRRDLAILVNSAISAEQITKIIREIAGNMLNKLIIFDIYQGQGVITGEKSMALGLIFQADDHTLIDEEVNHLIEQVLIALKQSINARLRD